MQVLYNCSWFTLTWFILDLHTFVAKSALSRLHALRGTLWPKFGGRRHKKKLMDRAHCDHVHHLRLGCNDFLPFPSTSAAGSPLGCGLAQSKSLSDKILLIPNSGHCKSLPENFQSDSRIPKLFFQYYASSTKQNICISHFQIHQ